MNRHALAYHLAPGTDQRALAIVRGSAWPVGGSAGRGARPLACTVFHRDGLLLRILDIEGDIGACLHGVAADNKVRWSESQLAALLSAPAVVSRAIEVRALHNRIAAPRIAGRFTDPALLPAGRPGATNRAALIYPVRAGHGSALQVVLAGGRGLPVQASRSTVLASTAVFRRGDLVVRLVEVAGDIAAGFAHLRTTVSRSPTAGRLVELLEPGYDLRTETGFARFLSTSAMTLVTDDRADRSDVFSDSRAQEG